MLWLRLGFVALAAASHPLQAANRANVLALYARNADTAWVAVQAGLSRRRVQSIVAEQRGAARLLVHPQLAAVVAHEAMRHGANYGVKMLLGALKARHPSWRWPRAAVRIALQAADPRASRARKNWARRRIERGVYHADHFMYSVHVDLACKLQQYSIYVGAAIDGRTRQCLALVSLTDKLPRSIYTELIRPMALEHGMPDQMVTDSGGEWVVAASVCWYLARRARRRRGSTRRPHRYVPSTRNVRPMCTGPARAIHELTATVPALLDSRGKVQLRDQHAGARAVPSPDQSDGAAGHPQQGR